MSILDQKISARRILGMVAGVVIIGIGIAVLSSPIWAMTPSAH